MGKERHSIHPHTAMTRCGCDVMKVTSGKQQWQAEVAEKDALIAQGDCLYPVSRI